VFKRFGRDKTQRVGGNGKHEGLRVEERLKDEG
jgi:hypothetical protein